MTDLFYILNNSTIFKHFRVYDVANLEQLNKTYKSDELWKMYAFQYYSPEFWINANKRNKKISMPLATYKLEIKRMYEYEKLNPMTIEEYYNLWKDLEKYRNLEKLYIPR